MAHCPPSCWTRTRIAAENVMSPYHRRRKSTDGRSRMSAGRAVVMVALLLLCALATPVLDAQTANPFRGKRLYVDPNSSALKQAASWQRSRPADAAALRRIGEQPQAMGVGDWNRDVRRDTEAIMKRVQ